jgi:hypothetical protein
MLLVKLFENFHRCDFCSDRRVHSKDNAANRRSEPLISFFGQLIGAEEAPTY